MQTSECPVVPPGRSSYLALVAVFSLSIAGIAWGQAGAETPAAGASGEAASEPAAEDETLDSHLGIRFVGIPGTSVLIATVETRVSDYAAFVKATGHPLPDTPHFEQGTDHPVVGVSREDAEAFCRWLTETERAQGRLTAKQSYRLPTRQEWNLAVGLEEPFAGRNALEQEIRSKTLYPWGEEWPPVREAGNFAATQIHGYDDGFVYTSPVGSFRPNRFGLYDLGGNAWEWCESDAVSGTPQWVLRGGSWVYFVPETLLASYEYRVPAGLKSSSFGFRCVFDDPDRISEVTRELIAAKKKEQDEARMRFVTEKKGEDLTPEEAEARKRELLQMDLATAEGEGEEKEDLEKAMARILDRVPEEAGTVEKATRWRTRPESYVARMGSPFENSMGMKFQALEGAPVLIGEAEVRVAEYALFREENPGLADTKPRFTQGDGHPVVKVSWNDAVSFCDWLTKREREEGWITETQRYRLPKDAEWSLAAGIQKESGATPAERSAEEADFFPWGEEWPPPNRTVNIAALNLSGYEDRSAYTDETGVSELDPSGIFDLGGNVSEWCLDSWEAGSGEKVIRGGSYFVSERDELVSSFRKKLDASRSTSDVGFRCVLAEE